MKNGTTYIGLDVHKESIQVAVLFPGGTKAVEWAEPNEMRAVKRLAKKFQREAPGEVVSCYEAGPCGYVAQRQLQEAGVKCLVVAPSLIPVKPGDRIKTDRRDARKLAELLRAGMLTEVHPPTPEEEAVRDLCRAREDAKEDLLRSRHRLSKFLLRQGHVWREGRAWTGKHRSWVRSLSFEPEAAQAVLEDYVCAIEQVEERIRTLEEKLEAVAGSEPYRERVGWLRCFRGIDTVTAMTILAELHNLGRFDSARRLMAYLGLVPSEHSSGERERRGRITKSGNRHVRRVLVEAAWHYRHTPGVGVALRRRRKGQPREVIALADKAQLRLHRRYWRLTVRGNKPHAKAVVAVARELAGFIWAVFQRETSQA